MRQNHIQTRTYWLTTSNNRYSILVDEYTKDKNEPMHIEQKLPPVYIENIERIQALRDLLDEITEIHN